MTAKKKNTKVEEVLQDEAKELFTKEEDKKKEDEELERLAEMKAIKEAEAKATAELEARKKELAATEKQAKNLEKETIAKFRKRLDVLDVDYPEDATSEELIKLFNDTMEGFNDTLKEVEVEDLLRQHNKEMANRLVRITLTCMNPAKSALKGEWFTIRNRSIGTIKKFIPFNTEAVLVGWHVPFAIFQHLKSREFFPSTTKKNKSGMDEPAVLPQKEFNISILPPLTQEEIDNIAQRQIASNTLKSV